MKFLSIALQLVMFAGMFPVAVFCRQDVAKTYQFKNGNWFNGRRFERKTLYSKNGVFTIRKPDSVDEVIDLAGGYVIPPFGDAHTHNLDGKFNLDRVLAAYIAEGTFYVQVLGNSVSGAKQARPFLNKPPTIDVVYANGMLTSTYGHPFMVYEPLAMGIYSPAEGYRRIEEVKKSRLALGESYWFLDTRADVDEKWPSITGGKPDLIKIALLDANNKRKPNPNGVDKGLSPDVAEYIVKKAHAEGLRVFAHIETADDFRLGLRIGVDGFAHASDYGWDGREELVDELTDADLKLAAKKRVVIIPTAARSKYSFTDYSAEGKETVDEKRRDRIITRQRTLFEKMLKAGCTIALGFDSYGSTVLPETLHFAENKIFDNATILRIATESTPQSIFPNRKIGKLADGYEASFLVLAANPLTDIDAIKKITQRFKPGRKM